MSGPPYRPMDAQVIPRFAGIRTFMRMPNVTDLEGVDAAAVGIPFDTGTSYRSGARFGPEAIRSASALLRPFHPVFGLDLVETLSVVDYGDLPVAPGDTEETFRRVEAAFRPLVEAAGVPVSMGGAPPLPLAERCLPPRQAWPMPLAPSPSPLPTPAAPFSSPPFLAPK